jgi:CubicO group peptidase (beta-lactamase class C family)
MAPMDAAREDPDSLDASIEAAASASGFSGVVRVDAEGAPVARRAFGLANRAVGTANDVALRYAIASGTKGLTALSAMSLVERGTVSLETTARSLLGRDLPLIDGAVTVEHLLTHRSGIGDYLDESQLTSVSDYVMTVPVHRLASTEEYLAVLDGHPMVSAPGSEFAYNNGGYVLLALLIERAAGASFYDLVDELVCRPSGLLMTEFLRTDELPGDVAIGYLEAGGLRTNALHLPVRGSGDGGAFSSVADMAALWSAVLSGRVVSPATLQKMTRPHTVDASNGLDYGLGLWLDPHAGHVSIHGFDAGVGFVSSTARDGRTTYTVMSNTSRGAWAMSQAILGAVAATQ